MTLIVEDGTVVANANCYCDEAYVDAYALVVNETGWAALTSAEKVAAIAKGAMVADDPATYVYDGSRQDLSQTMVWPRTGAAYHRNGPAIPTSTVPQEMIRANAVAAIEVGLGRIAGAGTPGQTGLIKSEAIDTMSVTYFSPSETGTSAASASAGGPYSDLGWPQITSIVAPLLDATYYEDQIAASDPATGVAPAVAARRGPSFTAPAYGGIFGVGMHDISEDDPIEGGATPPE